MTKKKPLAFSSPPWKRFGIDPEDRTVICVMVQELRRAYIRADAVLDPLVVDLDREDPLDILVARTRELSLITAAILDGFLMKFLGVTPEERERWNEAMRLGKPPVGVKDHGDDAMSDLIDRFAADHGAPPTDPDKEH